MFPIGQPGMWLKKNLRIFQIHRNFIQAKNTLKQEARTISLFIHSNIYWGPTYYLLELLC